MSALCMSMGSKGEKMAAVNYEVSSPVQRIPEVCAADNIGRDEEQRTQTIATPSLNYSSTIDYPNT